MTAEILVDLITAAIVPDAGEVRVFGQPTTAIADRDGWLQTLDQFGLLTERAVLVEQFTVEQNLAIPYSLSVEDLSADLRARVAALAQEIGFAPSDLAKQSGSPAAVGPAASSTGSRTGHGTRRRCWPSIPTRPLLLTRPEVLVRISSESSKGAGWPPWW